MALVMGCSQPQAPQFRQIWKKINKPDEARAILANLIMQDDLRYDDEAIAATLDVKRPSVRSMRSRIKGREK